MIDEENRARSKEEGKLVGKIFEIKAFPSSSSSFLVFLSYEASGLCLLAFHHNTSLLFPAFPFPCLVFFF